MTSTVDLSRSSCDRGGNEHFFHYTVIIDRSIRRNMFVPRKVVVGQEPPTLKRKLNNLTDILFGVPLHTFILSLYTVKDIDVLYWPVNPLKHTKFN